MTSLNTLQRLAENGSERELLKAAIGSMRLNKAYWDDGRSDIDMRASTLDMIGWFLEKYFHIQKTGNMKKHKIDNYRVLKFVYRHFIKKYYIDAKGELHEMDEPQEETHDEEKVEKHFNFGFQIVCHFCGKAMQTMMFLDKQLLSLEKNASTNVIQIEAIPCDCLVEKATNEKIEKIQAIESELKKVLYGDKSNSH